MPGNGKAVHPEPPPRRQGKNTIDIDQLSNDFNLDANVADSNGGIDSSRFISIDDQAPSPSEPILTSCFGGDINGNDAPLRRIDFVIVYRNRTNPNVEAPVNFEEIRRVYEDNLVKEGLVLQRVGSTVENEYIYVHIYAGWDVLAQYAEVMGLRMPMKTIKSSLKILFDEECNETSRAFTTAFTRDKDYLFDIPENDREEFFTPSQRTEIIDFILRRTRFNEGNDVFSVGINKLISDGVYVSAYPLHDLRLGCLDEKGLTKRRELWKEWVSMGRWMKHQPLDQIVAYFGVKISMYFAWVGFYTYMLIPAAIVGLIPVIYGALTISNSTIVRDVCTHPKTELMCPICAYNCNYTRIVESCPETKTSYVFGNIFTIIFSIFISVWATIYLEMWKRYSAKISHKWDLSDFSTIEEYPRPEFLTNLYRSKKRRINPVTRIEEPYIPFLWGRLPYFFMSSSLVLLCIVMALLIMVSIIVYRVSVQIAFLYRVGESSPFLFKYGDIIVTATAASINLCLIMLLGWIYKNLAYFLTEMEKPRTQNEFDNSLTLKMFLFQFVNFYSSFFYIAFFKGRFKLDPPEGGLREESQNYLVESCPIGGCYFDLTLQMVIIFVGKALINSIIENLWPLLQSIYNRHRYFLCRKVKPTKLKQWEEDFFLESWNHMSLFYEYLEMVIQFGFVTIFVSAFPLAPLFALINNIFEIRLDARKMLLNFKRPVAQRVKNIGIWYSILDAIGKISVFTNSMIIAFTTDIIPQVMYYVQNNRSLEGYFSSTLATYRITNADPKPIENGVHNCVYTAYRHSPSEDGSTDEDYSFMPQHYKVFIYKIIFVVMFQNVVAAVNSFLKYAIPDEPRQLWLQKRQHAYLTNELIIRHELSTKKAAADLVKRLRQGAGKSC